jgi:hypothetical protein
MIFTSTKSHIPKDDSGYIKIASVLMAKVSPARPPSTSNGSAI